MLVQQGKEVLSLRRLSLPVLDRRRLAEFPAGEEIILEGIIYTARDRVHREVSEGSGRWPFSLQGNAIYYCGPTPALKGFPLGSCGPTTSSRMDAWTPELYRNGVAVTIGKGPRNRAVISAIAETGGLYLAAYGGCGALYASKVKSAEVAGFEDYGPQAVYKVTVEDFPALVAVDAGGNSIY